MAAVEWNCPPIRQRGDEHNETIVMAAVQLNGFALKYASDEMNTTRRSSWRLCRISPFFNPTTLNRVESS
jgi:hypothetical protein